MKNAFTFIRRKFKFGIWHAKYFWCVIDHSLKEKRQRDREIEKKGETKQVKTWGEKEGGEEEIVVAEEDYY